MHALCWIEHSRLLIRKSGKGESTLFIYQFRKRIYARDTDNTYSNEMNWDIRKLQAEGHSLTNI